MATARSAEVDRRRIQALELRMAGASYRQIAQTIGCNVSTAYRHTQAALRRTMEEPAAEVRRLELLRIDRLILSRWSLAVGDASKGVRGDDAALDRVRALMRDRARLLGLDAPQRVSITLDEEAAQLAEALGIPVDEARAAVTEAEAEIRRAQQRTG